MRCATRRPTHHYPSASANKVHPSDTPSTYQIALHLLARRDLSTAQLRDRLSQRDRPRQEIEVTISRLTAAQVLDDARLAAAYAHRAVHLKLRGKRRTRRELEALGIAPTTADHAVDAIFDEVDEATVLERAVTKRLRGPIRTRTELRRVSQALIRQGFPTDQIQAALMRRATQTALEKE